MGDAPSKLPHGLHFLRLPQGIPGSKKFGQSSSLVGNVATYGIESAVRWIQFRHCRPSIGDGDTVGLEQANFEMVDRATCHQCFNDASGLLQIVRVDDLSERRRQKLSL